MPAAPKVANRQLKRARATRRKTPAAEASGSAPSKRRRPAASGGGAAGRRKGDAGPAPRSEGAGDEFYERICGAIMEHRLRPGTKPAEERLAEIFQASRAGIREVLARLVHEDRRAAVS